MATLTCEIRIPISFLCRLNNTIRSLTVRCIQPFNCDTNPVVFVLSTQQRRHVGLCFPNVIGWKYVGFLKQTTNDNETRDFLLACSVGSMWLTECCPYRCYCKTALSIPGEGLFLTSSTTFWLIIDDGDDIIDNDNIYLYMIMAKTC